MKTCWAEEAFLCLHRNEIIKVSAEMSVLVLLILLLAPVLRYLWTGWEVRRSEIVGTMSDQGIRLYFNQFYPAIIVPADDVRQFFDEHYARRYGRRHYIVPFALLAIVAGFSLFLAGLKVDELLNPPSNESLKVLRELPWSVVAATAGAYMWVMTDFISRSRSRDLAPAAIYWAALRFVISIPAGMTLSIPGTGEAGAFLLGAFPTQTLVNIARRLANRKLGLGHTGITRKHELERLQGITPGSAERFSDEGVLGVTQLAYCDPIDVTIRSNFSISYVADCVSQALAWLYFQDALPAIRSCSLRGAREIHALVKDLDGNVVARQEVARRVLAALSASTGGAFPALEEVLRQIARDPCTEFIVDIWEPPPMESQRRS